MLDKRIQVEILDKIVYKPIGVVHSSFEKPQDVPIQSGAAKGVTGYIEVNKAYTNGLKDLDGFSHLILIYHFHLAKTYSLRVKPFLDTTSHGLFSTRAPSRPNPIGISVVRLVKLEKNIIHIQEVDIIDNTPLLDIKPYVPAFDQRETQQIGWLTKNISKLNSTKDDGRFAQKNNT